MVSSYLVIVCVQAKWDEGDPRWRIVERVSCCNSVKLGLVWTRLASYYFLLSLLVLPLVVSHPFISKSPCKREAIYYSLPSNIYLIAM